MPIHAQVFALCLASSLASTTLAADLQLKDIFKQAVDSATQTTETPTTAPAANADNNVGKGLETSKLNLGVKQMLLQGSEQAIGSLGQAGGFLNNPAVKIPVPSSLSLLESGLRQAGQGQYIDDFVKSINAAAEQAVPEATAVFSKAIENMTPTDAMKILNGPENSVTEYFKKTSSEELKQRLLPLIKQATDKNGVTTAYKGLMTKTEGLNLGALGNVGSLLGGGKDSSALDLDQYVTDQSLEGLFKVMAEEEAKIRSNPAARATDLLKQIFGG